jgi:hypothetical protein
MPANNPPLWKIWQRFPKGVMWFTLAYMLLAAIGAIATGNREFVLYIVVMFLLIAGLTVIHSRVQLSLGLLWALSIWGLTHMAGGLVPVPPSWPIEGDIRVLYSWWIIPDILKYDHVVHAYGFGVATFLCWEGLRAAVSKPDDEEGVRPTAGLLLLCAAASAGFGAANEVVEFIATQLLPKTNVGGYENTGWDLVSNLAGAVIAALAIYAIDRRKD